MLFQKKIMNITKNKNFLVIFINFFTIHVVREKNKVRLALAIPNGAPTLLVNEIIDAPPIVALKQQHICLTFYCMIFFD